MTEDYSRQFESLQPLRARESVGVERAPADEAARTYPIEEAKPQEDLPNEN